MTVILEKYIDNVSGLSAEISIEKDSKLYTMTISKPIYEKPGFAITILKRQYMTASNARQAMRKQGNFTRGTEGNNNV